MRSMISSEPSSFSDSSNRLLASNLYTGEEGRGVEVSNLRKVISNGDETSRFGGRTRVIC